MLHHDKNGGITMPHLTIPQRAFWIALVTAAAPYAFFRLTLNPVLLFDGDLHFEEDDIYDDLRDGELAAEMPDTAELVETAELAVSA
jgi:hypothetical protein